jgi:hypothetical protein
MRAPMRGAVAPLAPRRESLLGSSFASHGPVARPPASVMSRPVVARRTPPSRAVPFEARQQALESRPGRPLDSETLSRLRQGAPAVRSPVNVVTPGYSRRGDGQRSFSQPGAGESRQPGVQRRQGPQPSPDPREPRTQLRRPGENWGQPGPAGDARRPREYPRSPREPVEGVRSPRQRREPAGEVTAPAEPEQRPQHPPSRVRTPDDSSRQFQRSEDRPQQSGEVRPHSQPSRQPESQQRQTRPGSRKRILDDEDSDQ